MYGIAIVGANGSGKTTLGKYLGETLGYKHMDIEDYSFKDSLIPYEHPLTKEEIHQLLLTDIKKYKQFILSAVNGDLGDDINVLYDCVIYIQVPLEIRLDRIKQRSIRMFGSRVLEGGDMYEQEQQFFNFVATRGFNKTEAWLKSLQCPIIYLDGTQPIASNGNLVKEKIRQLQSK